jgi:hypothetical protein
MPMREDCKHFESRTYDDGETMRTCALDLAPEAPWHCPPDCSAYAPRLADVGWAHGSLVSPPTPEEPPLDEGATEALEEAEEIVNAAAPKAFEEAEQADKAEQAGKPRRWASPFRWRRSKHQLG